jgi:hypothetical protein
MCPQHPPLPELPEGFPDEAVAQLIELLYELGRVLEHRYAGQLHRYYHRNEAQQTLWPDEELPF